MLAIKTNMDMKRDNPAETRQEVGTIAIVERASVISLSQGELTFIKTESYRLKLRGLLTTGKKKKKKKALRVKKTKHKYWATQLNIFVFKSASTDWVKKG